MANSIDTAPPAGGPIAWMARNHVAANLMMLLFLVGGLMLSTRVKQEIFPEFTADTITVSVLHRGASPAEVEQGVILSIEDEVRGLDGVKEVRATATESRAKVTIELLTGADTGKALQDVKNAVDSILSFPEEAERPIVSLSKMRNLVLTLLVHGSQDEQTLRDLAERIRDELLQRPGVTLIELAAARPLEISLEVPQRNLRAYNLTLDRIAREVREAAIELPAGGVKTPGGEVLLRTQERRDFAREYANIPVAAAPDGSQILVGDIAHIHDGFEETDVEAVFNGQRAVRIQIFRVGNESPQSVSDTVRAYVAEIEPDLPPGIGLAVWNDRSEVYRDRVNLLVKNAFLGLVLVLLLLGIFLDPKLAFWVTLGIPISILGSFLFLPLTGASINMISLFAFIITLGIVVDDAVVVGENVYERRERGMPFLQAAIEGARDIAGPVLFAVLTNIVAFLPLAFVPGTFGRFFGQIPAVVVAVFVVSLIESLFILPAHLSHQTQENRVWAVLGKPRRIFNDLLQRCMKQGYQPFLRLALANRYTTLATGIALLILAGGAIGGGHVPFSFIPRIDTDVVAAQATLPFGVPMETSRRVQHQLLTAAAATVEEHGGADILEGTYALIGASLPSFGPPRTEGVGGSHLVGVQVSLVSSDQREIGSLEFVDAWRAASRHIVGIETLTFEAETNVSEGADIDIQLTHRDRPTLEAAATELAQVLAGYAGVRDIDDGFARGKPQLSLTLKPEARSLGINATDLARQVRSAFYGAEALRQQRGRNEVRVMVRLPENERRTAHTVERLMLRTAGGGEIPLFQAADVERGRAYTEIRRREGRRIIAVTAGVDKSTANTSTIMAEVLSRELPVLMQKYPGLSYALEGEELSRQESLEALGIGFAFALLGIYGLLAVPFRSYVQPVLVMLSIPFGIIGALLGLILLGHDLSVISLFGIVALSGVVINDSLVLVVTANSMRTTQQLSASEAISQAGTRRFRPILLTSLTTFFGLTPMIFETSVQARFLVPMAISLGFGILFATAIILVLLPASYLILEDLQQLPSALRTLFRQHSPARPDPQ